MNGRKALAGYLAELNGGRVSTRPPAWKRAAATLLWAAGVVVMVGYFVAVVANVAN